MGREQIDTSVFMFAYSEELCVDSGHYSPRSRLLVILSLVALSWLLLGITIWASA
jgi:hypothetical protein